MRQSEPPAVAHNLLPDPRTLSARDILQLQRLAGNQAVAQLLAQRRPLTQAAQAGTLPLQRAVETNFGVFKDLKYEKKETKDPTDMGVDIMLAFEPNAKVDATKIGMVQSVKSFVEGSPHVLDPTQMEKLVKKQGPSAGYKMDRRTGASNPIYGAADLAPGSDLSATPETDSPKDPNYKLGWRYSREGTLVQQDAEMHDAPSLSRVKPNSGQVFETTALAIDGAQKGTYYGSVSWGWTTDGTGAFVKQPLAPESAGNPTSKFTDAAERWNAFAVPPKMVEIGEKLYQSTEPLQVNVKVGDMTKSMTLATGCELIRFSDKPIGQSMLFELDRTVRVEASRLWATVPLDKVDPTSRTLKDKVTVTIDGQQVTARKGTQILGGNIYEMAKEVTGYLGPGTLEFSATPTMRIGTADVQGVATTKLPIP